MKDRIRSVISFVRSCFILALDMRRYNFVHIVLGLDVQSTRCALCLHGDGDDDVQERLLRVKIRNSYRMFINSRIFIKILLEFDVFFLFFSTRFRSSISSSSIKSSCVLNINFIFFFIRVCVQNQSS